MNPLPEPQERSLRVLIVEDDPALGRLIRLSLSRFTTWVTVVRTGKAALAELDHGQHDVLACDISLPDISGLEIIARARAVSPSAGIVAITGFIDVDVAVKSMKAGADDFLGKPFDGEILWHMLNRAVDNRAQRVQAEQAALYRDLAYTDALTGCSNRRFIDEFIVDAIASVERSGGPLTVAYADIDNFKLLNDFLGHEHCDDLLKRVGEELRRAVTAPAVFGRFGGDEFVAVFPGELPERAAEVMAGVQRMVAGLEVANEGGAPLPTRLSVGLALYPGWGSPRALVASAEDQMYLDKTISPAHAAVQSQSSPEGLRKITNLRSLRNLVKAIDRRDSYTRYHSDHATRLALEVAARLGLSEDDTNAITIGGPIHDLGKIVVPDEILRKPGRLTREERRVMEEHPVIGAAIAATVTDYDTVISLVRHHHERFDGAGYPGGLRGTEISLPTRIFTVADAFSAMTTDRPYRRGLSTEEAVAQVAAGRGSQFDPDLGSAFVDMIESRARVAA